MASIKTLEVLIVTLLISFILPSVESIERDSNEIEKSHYIIFTEPIIRDEGEYISIILKEAKSNILKPGNPVLPVYTKTFKVPFGTKINDVTCIPSEIQEKTITKKINPCSEPSPVNFIKESDMKKVRNQRIYSSSDYYPDNWYNVKTGCGIDEFEHVIFITISIYPVRYSPERNIIQYTDRFEIKINLEEIHQSYLTNDRYDMIIIFPSEFTKELELFSEYKNICGISNKLVTLNDIYSDKYFTKQGRDQQEQIKYFIKNAIENWGISYVLIIGGADKTPVRKSYVQDGEETYFISDLYYADIYNDNSDFSSWDSNGNNIFGEYNYMGRTDEVDLYPDVYFGRLVCATEVELRNVLDKIIEYSSKNAPSKNWFSDIIVCGGDTHLDSESINEGEYMNQRAIDIMSGFTPIKIWESNGQVYESININNAINNGAGFTFFSGHGTVFSWATHPHNDMDTWIPNPWGGYVITEINYLSNAEKLPIVIIQACSPLNFLNSNECIGWAWLKNQYGGGIASFGNSGLGWGSGGYETADRLGGAMALCGFRAYANQNSDTLGELWSNAVTSYLNDYWNDYSLDYKTVEEWQSFCDPSLSIVEIVSERPNKPEKPSGPTEGKSGENYVYSCLAVDPDDDKIKYCYDWDDGNYSWTDWLNSGENAEVTHSWQNNGLYSLKVKAFDINGLGSDWSDSLSISMPKTKNIGIGTFDLKNIQNFFPYQFFQILRQVLFQSSLNINFGGV